ncbi:MAG: hypothetical protein KGJ79_17975 [Alphaproteobacteria bacterium]|nr:hypothetical protein [Alphaproteobacteria bacterium]MDE2113029.1 hypothetical protein [Alphaproteobacteria bacterium]
MIGDGRPGEVAGGIHGVSVFVRASKDRIAACRDAATKAKKEERCTIAVQGR